MAVIEAPADWYARVSADPIVFAKEAMRCDGVHNEKLTKQQRTLLNAAKREAYLPVEERLKRIAVKSGQGTGKTTCECILALWRAFWAVDALVVVTAPTMQQVKDAWIAEMRRLLMNAHPFIRRMTKVTYTKVIIGGRKTWGIWTRAASRPENFQGYHQKFLTMIVDEASGVSRDIFKTIKGTLTNENSLLVCAGNPNTRECAFFDMFHKPSERSLWHRFTFNAEESPITDKSNLAKIAQEFGKDSDVYRVRVLGEFPLSDPNCVVSSEDLWACHGVPILQAAKMKGDSRHTKAFGIDFARFGSDESVIVRRSGLAAVDVKTFAKKEPMQVLEEAFAMQRRVGWKDNECIYVVDAGGMGQGVLGPLYRAGKNVHEFQSQHRSSDPAYADKITEAYFNIRSLARKRKIHVPNDEHMIEQLSTRLYAIDTKSKIKLESKKDYVKRTESSSPDRADAFVMAFYAQTTVKASMAL